LCLIYSCRVFSKILCDDHSKYPAGGEDEDGDPELSDIASDWQWGIDNDVEALVA
jgi:hypothetical protein